MYKIKTENHIDDDLEKCESDSHSNDEKESDIDKDEYMTNNLLKVFLIAIKT